MKSVIIVILLSFLLLGASFLNPAASFDLPFPRLGMWWPNTHEQPLKDIARYDWVVLTVDDNQAAKQLKKLNANMVLLTSTNACELSYTPDESIGGENQILRNIPAEWFLTQVGSTLREDVDKTTKIIPVEAVIGEQGLELFIPGDTAVIEGESVLIQSVNSVSRSLIVQRGYVRSAAAHKAGTRIAAHISFWPHTWLLNLSTLSRKAVMDKKHGSETWAEFHARRTAQLLNDPIWDGILIDRSDSDESWLIGSSTARSIDPDQSNRVLTDYAPFDRAWNEGLRRYEQLVRENIGEEKLVLVNWGMPNYDLLNGNNFEGFPQADGSSYRATWNQTMFGTVSFGSYIDWLKQARQPNLSMIETYEDDGFPEAASQEVYDNPCEKPGFKPNYQKMRFGLSTALLGDGFFSYEINTNGHGSLCLMWFDEYDNMGMGRGYLGKPLQPAKRLIDELKAPNLLQGGELNTQEDLEAWSAWAEDGSELKATINKQAVNGESSVLLQVNETHGVDWEASFSYEPIEVTQQQDYTLSFWAKADASRSITVWVQQSQEPWQESLDFGKVLLKDTWQQYVISVPAIRSEKKATLNFGVGAALGKVRLDEIRLQKGSQDVYWREFEGGLVLVNATSQAQTVFLPRTYRKMHGKQVPFINDGSLVKEVRLLERDGIILLNP